MEIFFQGVWAWWKIYTLQYFWAQLSALSLKPTSTRLAHCCQSLSTRALGSLILGKHTVLRLQEKVSAMLSTDLANQYLTPSLPSFIFLCSCPTGSGGSILTVFMLTFAIIALSSPSFLCCSRQLTSGTEGLSLVATGPPCPLELLSKELALNHKSAINMFCQHSVVGKSNEKKGK